MKTRAHSRFRSDLAFLDAILNMTLAFTFLFVIAYALIRPPTPPIVKNAELKAEFIITMTWPEETLDDIDLWVLLPDGRRVMYTNKEVEYVTLDRDDRGGYGDTYSTEGEGGLKKLIRANKEMITIRAIVPGRYVVAAHVFAIYDAVEGIKTELSLPYETKLEVTKINPRVIEVAKASVTLDKPRQQKTFIAFTVAANGFITDVELDPPDEIVTDTTQ